MVKHTWAWQLAFAFSTRTQVCTRPGCGWRRKRVEVRGNRRGIRSRVTRWAYAMGPGRSYRLLLSVPRCPGAYQWPTSQPRGKAAARRGKKGSLLAGIGGTGRGP